MKFDIIPGLKRRVNFSQTAFDHCEMMFPACLELYPAETVMYITGEGCNCSQASALTRKAERR